MTRLPPDELTLSRSTSLAMRLVKAGLALAATVGLGLMLLVVFAYVVRLPYNGRLYASLDRVPPRRVAIVFGAGVWPNGQLSAVLEDRVWTAAALYEAGIVEKLLMTGDNRLVDYNEPQRMAEYAQALGVPAGDIVLDYAGRRTYDSCYRALHVFGVSDAVLVTQRFHLPRALLIAEGLGLDAVGVIADRRPYYGEDWYKWREVPATLVAWWQVHVTRPEPILGEKLPIFDAG